MTTQATMFGPEAAPTRRRKPAGAPRFPLVGPTYSVRLVRENRASAKLSFACADDIYASLRDYMRALPHEEFWVILCDVKNSPVGSMMVSRGILDASLVHPRECFRPAILAGAASVILAHNHPSGDPEPSSEDVTLTKRLVEAGALLGIPVLDHIVCGTQGFVSFSMRGWI